MSSIDEARAEALRRIKQARELRSEILYLGDLEVNELPGELGNQPDLRILALGLYRPVLDKGQLTWNWKGHRNQKLSDVSPLVSLSGLTTLDLSGCEALSDVSPLASLSGLTSLDLSECPALSDVSPLASLSGLTTLDLSGCPAFSDVSPLVSLSGLTTLDLSGCEALSDVSPLASLSGLTTLDLSWCPALSDVSPLASLSGLTTLDLSWCPALSDVSPLASLSGLTTLNLRGWKALSDVSPLASLSGLTRLDLSECPALSDVSPLASLSGLTRLDLSWCPALSDVSPLASLSGLTSLDLSECPALSDVSPLASLSGLTSLDLSECPALSDVSPLASLSGLTTLNLRGWKALSDVSPLASLSGLTRLDLSECPALSDVSPLASLSGLTTLDLSWCPALSDVSPLASLSGLTTLDLSWCPALSDVSPLASLSGLTTLNLRGWKALSDVSPLASLSGLTRLDLSECPALSDVSPLASLSGLTRLDLSWCPALSDVSPLASLSGLTSLDLSECPALLDVSPLASLSGLTSLDLSECPALLDVSPLASLSGLTTLNLRGWKALSDVSPLASLSGLTRLDLSGCPALSDVSPLASLSGLTTLNLRGCEALSDVSPLASLSGLTTLNLRGCEALSDVSPLASLSGLTTLNLRGCEALSDVSPLASLSGLTRLDLSGCPALSDVSPLASLSGLTRLDLSGCPALSDVSPLASLSGLTRLDLSGCPALSDVSPLASLSGLTRLDLSGCPALSDVSPLASLSGLTTLNLRGCEALSDVSPLASLSGLTSLDLSGCEALSDVSPLASLSGLTTLDLSGCEALSDVSPLASLSGLTTLDLSGCKQVRLFAPIRYLLSLLKKLFLYGSNFADLPDGVCGSAITDNVIGEVQAYYADLEAGEEADSEVKLFVLGNGRVGKTQLVRRLRGEAYDANVPTTHGVEWHSFTVQASDGSPVRINLWDFGGQDIYHGSHAKFLDGHAVFVVLWHPEFEDSTTQDNGLTITNHPLSYWLDYIRAAAGPAAVVLLVQARADTLRDEYTLPTVDLADLRVRQTVVSAKTGRGLEALLAQIGGAVRDLLDARPPYLIGRGRLTVRNRLRALLEQDQERPKAARKHRTLKRTEFDRLCSEVGGVSSTDALLTFLHRTGVVFHNPDLFGGEIVLDQQWALDAIYTLLDRARIMPMIRDCGGRFTRIDLEQLVWSKYTKAEQQTFLGMMMECHICFQSGTRRVGTENEPVYVAPELLADDRDTILRVLAGRVPSGEPAVTAKAWFSFLHDGVLRSVLALVGREFGDRATYWKWGCFLFDERTNSRVWIEAARGDPADGPGNGFVTIRLWGQQPDDVIPALAKVVCDSAGRQKPKWTLGRNDRSAALDFIVPIHREADTPVLVPGIPPESEAVVAISYGHGDNRDEKGRARGTFVDGLERAMPDWGYRPLRDVNELKNCGLIREFVLTLAQHASGRPRRVVLVLTDKYLRSVYCMSELYAVWQFSLGDRAAFAERIVPCILEEDLRLDDWRGRTAWAKYWKDEHDAMTVVSEGLGRDDKNLWHEIGRWVRDVPDMLAFVSNMVSERGYDTLTADKYAAVRRMLERPGRI